MPGLGVLEQSLLEFHLVMSLWKITLRGASWKKAGVWDTGESWLVTEKAGWYEDWNTWGGSTRRTGFVSTLTGFLKLYRRKKFFYIKELMTTRADHLIPIKLPFFSTQVHARTASRWWSQLPSGSTSGLTAGWPCKWMGGGAKKTWSAILSCLICLFIIVCSICVCTARGAP